MVSARNVDTFEWNIWFEVLFDIWRHSLWSPIHKTRGGCVANIQKKESIHQNSTCARRTQNRSQLGPISNCLILELLLRGASCYCCWNRGRAAETEQQRRSSRGKVAKSEAADATDAADLAERQRQLEMGGGALSGKRQSLGFACSNCM